MVTNIATLGRNGIHDYILVRASALILSAFSVLIIGFFVCTPDVTFTIWQAFFAKTWVKAFTLLALFSLLIHAWIGLWQVLSDYVKNTAVRLSLQFILNLAAISYLVVGIIVLWGV